MDTDIRTDYIIQYVTDPMACKELLQFASCNCYGDCSRTDEQHQKIVEEQHSMYVEFAKELHAELHQA